MLATRLYPIIYSNYNSNFGSLKKSLQGQIIFNMAQSQVLCFLSLAILKYKDYEIQYTNYTI